MVPMYRIVTSATKVINIDVSYAYNSNPSIPCMTVLIKQFMDFIYIKKQLMKDTKL